MNNRSKAFLAGVATLLIATPVYAQGLAVAAVAGVTVRAAMSGLSDKLSNTIEAAQDTGDYLMLEAAVKARDAIRSWEAANQNLLDTAFKDLDDEQRKVFDNANQTLDTANTDARDRLTQVQDIETDVAQLVESTPVTNNTYVTDFSPHVKPAQARDSITVSIKGVNLDKGDAKLALTDGVADRIENLPEKLQFQVPVSSLASASDKLSVTSLELDYTTPKDGFWNRAENKRVLVKRQLSIATLPKNIGHYTYVVTVTSQQKAVERFTSQSQRFSASHADRQNIATPPGGWSWDWSQGQGAFKQIEYGGEAGRCKGIDANDSSESGIKHSAHLDKIKTLHKFGNGWVDCSVTGPIYKMVSVTTTSVPQKGDLTWTDDLALQVPVDTKVIDLEITKFDGTTRHFTGTDHDPFFEVSLEGQVLIIHPKQPPDM